MVFNLTWSDLPVPIIHGKKHRWRRSIFISLSLVGPMHNIIQIIILLHGIDNIMWNIPHVQYECRGIFRRILSVPHNTIMDMKNVMWLMGNLEYVSITLSLYQKKETLAS
jgi:hypothetical protein